MNKSALPNLSFFSLSSFQSVTRSSVTDRLTDTSRYGGTHKQRFDETGKGRGKAGREDGKGDGYVAGYKHKGTYEAHGGKTKS